MKNVLKNIVLAWSDYMQWQDYMQIVYAAVSMKNCYVSDTMDHVYNTPEATTFSHDISWRSICLVGKGGINVDDSMTDS